MALNWKVVSIGMIVVFIAVISLLFVVEYIARSRSKCEINKNLEICKLGTIKLMIVVLMLVLGGLVVVVGVTSYILLSSKTEV